MEQNRINIKLCYLISGIFVLSIGTLAILSLFMHCETSLYDYDQIKSIASHTFYIYLGFAVTGILAVSALFAFLEYIFRVTGKGEIISNRIFVFCGILILFAGIGWIIFNDSMPVYDQKAVYAEARRIASALKEPFDTGYFAYFSRNRGIALLVAVAIKIFGDQLYSFRIFNLIGALMAYYSVCKTAKLVYQNPIITVVTAVSLTLFYPLTIYTSFYYGTLLSAAFAALGLYATVALCKTEKLRYGILMIFAFPLGIFMHQSAAIGLVASGIYLFMNVRKRTLLRTVLILGATMIVMLFMTKAADIAYIKITGADPNTSSVPVACTIYMGLTSNAEDAGPGSQDGSFTKIFQENGCDGKAASRDAWNRILVVIKEYLTGERNLKFFLEKTKYQWLDPTFGARKIIRTNDVNLGDPPNSVRFMKFYNSNVRNIIFKFSIGAMLLTYIGALFNGIRTFLNVKADNGVILIQLYVIGGFAFQLLGESLSRYCFCYFLWLIPGMVSGIYYLYISFRAQRDKPLK